MVDLCPVFEWWFENLTETAYLWSKMSSIQMVLQVTWPYHLNTGHLYCQVFRWIWYSDSYCIVFFQQDLEHWQTVFYIAASVYVVGNSFFLLFGSGVEQSWNKPDLNQDQDQNTSEVDGRRVEGKF